MGVGLGFASEASKKNRRVQTYLEGSGPISKEKLLLKRGRKPKSSGPSDISVGYALPMVLLLFACGILSRRLSNLRRLYFEGVERVNYNERIL